MKMMRKQNREVTDFNEIVDIIERCQTIRIGMIDNNMPYIVPMNFGYKVVDGSIVFYTHGAKEGRKHDIIKINNNVFIELDICHGYVDLGKAVTCDYESVMGEGMMEMVEDFDEQVEGIELLLKHCKTEKYSAKECAQMGITEVFKITLNNISAKRRFKRE